MNILYYLINGLKWKPVSPQSHMTLAMWEVKNLFHHWVTKLICATYVQCLHGVYRVGWC